MSGSEVRMEGEATGRKRPVLETDRLRLRPLASRDAPAVAELAGRREIWQTTLNIPHPYEPAMAVEWIAGHEPAFRRLQLVNFGLFERPTGDLVGTVGLSLKLEHRRGELGYWIGVPFWGRGYATEAVRALIDWAFPTFDLHRVEAHHFEGNDASGAVMRKVGMSYEARVREPVLKDGKFLDIHAYAILRKEWEALKARG